MSHFESNNVHLNGSGTEAMVFAHGFGCDQTMWRFVEPEFRRDFRTVLFDLTGCGKSDISQYKYEKYDSLRGHVEDLLELLDELQLTKVTFAGHSVSCMIGLLASIQEPARFRRLIMAAPSPCYINHDDYTAGFQREDIDSLLETLDLNYLSWSRDMAPVIMGNPERPQLGDELTSSFCSNDPAVASHFAGVTFNGDNRKDLALCRTPALILQCTDDVIAPLAVGEYLHRHLSGSTLCIMSAVGHCPNLSAPAETIACIRPWLENS